MSDDAFKEYGKQESFENILEWLPAYFLLEHGTETDGVELILPKNLYDKIALKMSQHIKNDNFLHVKTYQLATVGGYITISEHKR